MKAKMIYMAILPLLCGCMVDDPEYFKKPDWWSPEEEDNWTGEYRLVWSDEFDAQAEDGKDWAYPSDDWTFETGGTGWGNDEDQYYVDKAYGD
ncbi:MAG: hypothetical protein SPE21_06015, partial [Candidatus Cryptobacteroides sp.]|nr:hypothetical protein [Candidatus Cryptobacteroides sp.]